MRAEDILGMTPIGLQAITTGNEKTVINLLHGLARGNDIMIVIVIETTALTQAETDQGTQGWKTEIDTTILETEMRVHLRNQDIHPRDENQLVSWKHTLPARLAQTDSEDPTTTPTTQENQIVKSFSEA